MNIVYLNDEGLTHNQAVDYYNDADKWAKANCPSYVGNEVVDVSDFSYTHDLLAQYKFKDEKDVIMFTLKWQ